MELNPNHPVTKEVHNQWHKIAALLMVKFKQTHVEITIADIMDLNVCGTSNIVIESKKDKLIVRLVDDLTALKLSEKEGG